MALLLCKKITSLGSNFKFSGQQLEIFQWFRLCTFCCRGLGRVTSKVEVKQRQGVLASLFSSVFEPRLEVFLCQVSDMHYIGETWRRWELFKHSLWPFSASGKFVRLCDGSRLITSVRFASLSSHLADVYRQCRVSL